MYVRGSLPTDKDEPDTYADFFAANPERRALESDSDYINKGIKDAENHTNSQPRVTIPPKQPKQKRSLSATLTGGMRQKYPAIVIIVALFGGGSIFNAIFAPGIAITTFASIVGKDTNSQLAAITKTDAQLMRAKFKKSTAGSCGLVKVACRFKEVKDPAKFKAAYKAAGINVEFDTTEPGKIKSMTHTDSSGKKVVIDSADGYTKEMTSNIHFRSAVFKADNPSFVGLKDRASMKYLTDIKTNYAKKLTGKDKKELDKNMDDAIDGKSSMQISRIKQQTDKDGNTEYVDDEGNKYTAEEYNSQKSLGNTIEKAEPSTKVLDDIAKKGAVKSISVLGAATTACEAYSASRAVEIGSKAIQALALARLAMVVMNTESAMRAGKATPEQVEYIGKKIAEPDMRQKVADLSKLDSTPADGKLPEINNPDYKKAGMDAEFYKMSSEQKVPKYTPRNQRFLVGGTGAVGFLSSMNKKIANMLGLSSPRQLSHACHEIKSPVVQGGALVLGFALGVGTFGLGTLALAGLSMGFSLMLPYLTSVLSDIVAGKLVSSDLTGTDFVDAAAVGVSQTQNGMARQHALMQLPPDQMVEYQNTNRQVQIAYDEVDKLAAKNAPLDITNQYSLLGSLAQKSLPISLAISSSLTGTIQSLPIIFSTAATSFIPSASAYTSQKVNPDRYKSCKLPSDTERDTSHTTRDATCVTLYGLPKQAMEMGPVEAAKWMADNDEIDPNDESGAPKDNDKDWNYKKYVENCQNKDPTYQEDPEDNTADGCDDPKNFDANWHYAKYALSNEWDSTINQDIPGLESSGQQSFATNQKGKKTLSGWAYPTTNDAVISVPFNGGGSSYNGVELAQAGNPLGQPIFAARDGKVLAAGPIEGGLGNWIVIQSKDENDKRVDTVYARMDSDGIFVKPGDTVKAGQQIGRIGQSGDSRRPQLHFELWPEGHPNFDGKGVPTDPTVILKSAHDGPVADSSAVGVSL